jgi:hypothetical protein
VLLCTGERGTSAVLESLPVERGAVHHADPSPAPRSWQSGKSFFIWNFLFKGRYTWSSGHLEFLMFDIGFSKMAARGRYLVRGAWCEVPGATYIPGTR